MEMPEIRRGKLATDVRLTAVVVVISGRHIQFSQIRASFFPVFPNRPGKRPRFRRIRVLLAAKDVLWGKLARISVVMQSCVHIVVFICQ